MSKFRYVAVAPDRIEQQQKLGAASYLHDFLVDHQTDADGNVYYGKPIGYAWIRSRWANAPSLSTLKRWMARLKRLGHIEVRVFDGSGVGKLMAVKILGSVKFSAPVSRPSVQIPLFAPRVASMPCAKPVNNTGNGSHGLGSKMAPTGGQKWPHKEVRKELKKQTEAEPASAEVPAVENQEATAPDRNDGRHEALASLRTIAKAKALPETPAVPSEVELMRRRDEQLRRMDGWTKRHSKAAAAKP